MYSPFFTPLFPVRQSLRKKFHFKTLDGQSLFVSESVNPCCSGPFFLPLYSPCPLFPGLDDDCAPYLHGHRKSATRTPGSCPLVPWLVWLVTE